MQLDEPYPEQGAKRKKRATIPGFLPRGRPKSRAQKSRSLGQISVKDLKRSIESTRGICMQTNFDRP